MNRQGVLENDSSLVGPTGAERGLCKSGERFDVPLANRRLAQHPLGGSRPAVPQQLATRRDEGAILRRARLAPSSPPLAESPLCFTEECEREDRRGAGEKAREHQHGERQRVTPRRRDVELDDRRIHVEEHAEAEQQRADQRRSRGTASTCAFLERAQYPSVPVTNERACEK